MKKCILVAGFLIVTSIIKAQTTDVLFLGNSYTNANNLPQLVNNLAVAAGYTMFTDNNTPGGYTLQLHTTNATTLSKIAQQPWHVVIVQAQSQEPSLDSVYVAQNVLPYAQQLESLIAQNDSCTRTVFYMTWGRKFGDASNCAAYPPVCTYAGMQGELRRRYLLMAQQNNAAVAPVGVAWQNVLATNPAFDLYVSDGSHPSMHGSYLAACVIFTTIYRQSPVGLTYYAGLPAADAQLIQTIAGSTVLDSMPVWQTEIDLAVASGLTATPVSNYTYDFSLQTTFANAYSWNFGDNTGWQTAGNPVTHTYPGPGTYTVSGVVLNGCFTDTITQQVTILPASLPDANWLDAAVYPNPSAGQVTVILPNTSPAQLTITDVSGRIVLRETVQPDASGKAVIEQLKPGIYNVDLRQDALQFVSKLVV
ncbi:MAG: T9SS type A sorting domain-containing protein, partial [Bacteroidia bacterium]